MAHANQKHSNQSPSNAQLKTALSLIAAELARGPLRSFSLSQKSCATPLAVAMPAMHGVGVWPMT